MSRGLRGPDDGADAMREGPLVHTRTSKQHPAAALKRPVAPLGGAAEAMQCATGRLHIAPGPALCEMEAAFVATAPVQGSMHRKHVAGAPLHVAPAPWHVSPPPLYVAPAPGHVASYP